MWFFTKHIIVYVYNKLFPYHSEKDLTFYELLPKLIIWLFLLTLLAASGYFAYSTIVN